MRLFRFLPFVESALLAGFLLAVALPLSAASEAEHALLDADKLPSDARFTLVLHAGDYQIRSSTDGHLHVLETRNDSNRNEPATSVRYHVTSGGAHLEIESPTHKNSPHLIVALPACASLNLRLSAGELVFDSIPCEATTVDLHAGELRARIEDPESFHTVTASVSIGEIDAHGLGRTDTDENHGGFFRSFDRGGAGPRRFAAHVGTGQITLDGRKQ